MSEFHLTSAQVMPALVVAIVIEARYVMASNIWKSQTLGWVRRFQSLIWAIALYSLWKSEIGILSFLAYENSAPINNENILEALNISMFAIAFSPIIEVLFRGYHFIVAFFAIETPIIIFRALNFIWKKNLSPSKFLISRNNQKILARTEALLGRINSIPSKNASISPKVLLELKAEVNEVREAAITREAQLRNGNRFKEDIFDKDSRRKRVNLLSDKLLGASAD